jgi:hypothetical membrane protein
MLIVMTLIAPVVALGLLLCMPAVEHWYEPSDNSSSDAPPL